RNVMILKIMIFPKVIKETRVDDNVHILQADDGFTYYSHHDGKTKRLYVKILGVKKYLKFNEIIHMIAIHESTVYIVSDEQVYNVVFTHLRGFKITFLRNLLYESFLSLPSSRAVALSR
ncbi:hypothetical protein PMAYCL1PPCAC_09484, partial [Pristionchus mayeri]